jgi:ABC-2 type transport system permease protein
MKKSLFTVWIFTKLNTRRFFRDRLAIFFSILFPLMLLSVFGFIFGRDHGTSFKVAVINDSDTAFSKQFVKELSKQKLFEIDKDATSFDKAEEKMNRSQMDGAIVLPEGFGSMKEGQQYPSGQAQVFYTANNEQAGAALASILDAQLKGINAKYVQVAEPFKVEGKRLSQEGLSQFDYTFAGLLGFSIIGLGIFGPVNVFPELKKQGILRRLHTTPIKVWQYFLSTVITQVFLGMISIAVMFAVAILAFDLHVAGNWLELIPFLMLSIVTILGIGLALGGWAKNERQVAPLANIIVFPMMFLSGTFFPRYIMPDWLQNVSSFIPLSPAIDGVRQIATEGKGLLDVLPQIGILGAWLLVIYVIAFRVFRWE